MQGGGFQCRRGPRDLTLCPTKTCLHALLHGAADKVTPCALIEIDPMGPDPDKTRDLTWASVDMRRRQLPLLSKELVWVSSFGVGRGGTTDEQQRDFSSGLSFAFSLEMRQGGQRSTSRPPMKFPYR